VSPKDSHVIVSGGFDPIHLGHLNLINEASKLGKVIVIVNSDEFLLKKKGFYLIPSNERVEIIKNIKNVESVFLSIDKDESVSESIKTLAANKAFNIKFFANGGDRKIEADIPEQKICVENPHNSQ
jgi:D-beta-D-heptose 7-phosphate kinase/D-beta-D-heptose 1-phosphate adenosyltransferase